MQQKMIAILLSTYNGRRFLREQVESLNSQTFTNWRLFWRDDGSSDGTPKLMEELSADSVFKVTVHEGQHLGFAKSFITLLQAADNCCEFFAFCDQDDIWLPHKLEWAVTQLEKCPPNAPMVYCTRQILVDENLAQIGVSSIPTRELTFANLLVDNVAAGCTLVMNSAARDVVLGSRFPQRGVPHDWWSALVTTAVGGTIVFDERPTLLYRQHGSNALGAPRPTSYVVRVLRALKRGPTATTVQIGKNIAGCLEVEGVLDENKKVLAHFLSLYSGLSLENILRSLTLPGRKETRAQTILLKFWFLCGLFLRRERSPG